MDFYETALATLSQAYPSVSQRANWQERLSPLLISPHTYSISQDVKEKIQAVVCAFHALRNSPSYQEQALTEQSWLKVLPRAQTSALMSFDIHLTSSEDIKLIEINTNASLSLICDVLLKLHGQPNPWVADFSQEIIRTFSEEYIAAQMPRPLKRVAIVDADPENQRLFLEFEMFQELFIRHGYECLICDPKELALDSLNHLLTHDGKIIDLVYNRHTDFYFSTAECSALKKAYLARTVCVSPQPLEYALLADKSRLCELSMPNALDHYEISVQSKSTISSALLSSIAINQLAHPETLWQERKKYFFKPKNLFGGKAAYRGANVTRSVFAQILQGDYIAQEYLPAPQFEPPIPANIDVPLAADSSQIETPNFKFDLRFYTYRERIQMGAARLWRGQMTNSRTIGGGLAPIVRS